MIRRAGEGSSSQSRPQRRSKDSGRSNVWSVRSSEIVQSVVGQTRPYCSVDDDTITSIPKNGELHLHRRKILVTVGLLFVFNANFPLQVSIHESSTHVTATQHCMKADRRNPNG